MINGNFQAKATKVELGINKKDQPELRIDFLIVGGEHDGEHVPYSGNFTERGVKYTKRTLTSLGWSGTDVSSAIAEITKAAKTVPIEVVIASWKNPDTGQVREWSTVRSVGSQAEALRPLDSSNLKNINEWLTSGKDEVPF